MAASVPKQSSMTNKGINADRPGYLKVPPSVRDSRKLFVGGLPTDITEEEFQTFFAQFGTIADSTVMIDRVTHRSRGFGFVTFDDESVSLRLLNQQDGTGKIDMRGKEIELKKAQPKHPTRAAVPSVASPAGVTHHYFEEPLLQYGVPVPMHYYPAPMTPYYHPIGYDAVAPAPTYPVFSSYPYTVAMPSPAMVADSGLQ